MTSWPTMAGSDVAKVVGIESRGFIYGAILAQRLRSASCPFGNPEGAGRLL